MNPMIGRACNFIGAAIFKNQIKKNQESKNRKAIEKRGDGDDGCWVRREKIFAGSVFIWGI